jgi:cyclopropane fatty-acyl-phospholipid synthase-like methyltransferase
MEDLFDGSRKDSLRLQLLGWGDKLSEIFNAAIELGLFTKVSEGADTLPAIAEALELLPLNAERLVVACTAMDLLRRDGDRFSNAPDVERFLVAGRKNYQGPWFQWWRKKDHPGWHQLADFLRRKDAPTVIGENYAHHTVDEARDFHEGMYAVGMGAAHLFHRTVDLSNRKLILDLGGGSGHYCIVAAQKYPEIRGIIFDLPSVVEVTREYIAKNGQSDRITAQGGDFTADPLPTGADVTFLNGNGTIYGPDAMRAIIAKAHDAMVPGGEMHIIFEMLDDDKTGPVNAALFGVYEALMGSEGKAHSVADVKGYMTAAGFVNVSAHDFLGRYIRRVTGRKE